MKYLLEDSVIEYIEKHKLYMTSSVLEPMDIGHAAAITTLGLTNTSGANLGFLDKYAALVYVCLLTYLNVYLGS